MNSLIDFNFPHTGTKTQKLMGLIDSAMKAPSLLPGVPLKYRVSGDVVELHIQLAGLFNEDYRLAIINSGMVLSYIERIIKEMNYAPFIQSFPSIEEPRLVAFIRIEKPIRNGVSCSSMDFKNGEDAGLFPSRHFMTDHNVSITEIKGTREVAALLEACRDMKIDTGLQYIKTEHLWNMSLRCDNDRLHSAANEGKVWLVSTSMNNAIAWLNIGQVLGKLMLMCNSGSFPYQLDINLLENTGFRGSLNNRFSIPGYTQMLIKSTNYD